MPYRTAFEEPDRLFEAEISVDYDVPLAAAHRAAFGGLALCGEFAPVAFQPALRGRHDRVTVAVLRSPIVRKSGYRSAQLHELMAFHAAFPGIVSDDSFLAAFGSVRRPPSCEEYQWFPMIVSGGGLRCVSGHFYRERDGFSYLANYYPLATWSSVVVR